MRKINLKTNRQLMTKLKYNNSQVIIDLEQKNRELSILHTIAEGLNQEIDLNKALSKTLKKVLDLFGLQTGWIWLFHEETQQPYLAASHKLPPALKNNPTKMEGYCFCLESFIQGNMEEAVNINAVKCSRLKNLQEGTNGLLFHSSVPILAHGKRMGMLNVANPNIDKVEDDDLRLLHTIGDMLGLAVERALLFKDSQEKGVILERNRLAREIHDTIAQGLTGIILQLETAEEILIQKEDAERLHELIHQALDLTRKNLKEARRSVQDLRAAPLEGKTLPEAIKSIIGNTKNPRVKFRMAGENQPLSTKIETVLFRIIQEAYNNSIQHANATQIEIDLTISPNEIFLVIWDNGNGFMSDKIINDKFGLTGINERVKLLGGKFDLQTEINKGTRLEIHLPLGG